MIAQNLTLLAERSQAPGNWRVRVLRSFGRMRYQLLGGLLFGVICPILLRNQGLLGVLAPNDVNYQNSLLGTFVALILGFVVFGDWPSALTLVGAGIVVATGIYTLYRERAVARAGKTG